MWNRSLALMCMSLSLMLFACSSGERRVDNVVVAPTASDNPAEEIASLEREIDAARNSYVAINSPTWFQSAENSLTKAKRIRDEGGNFSDIFKFVSEGKAQLARARDVAKVAEGSLSDVTDARNRAWGAYKAAEAAGGTQMKPLMDDLKRADQKFLELTKALEENNQNRISQLKPEMLRDYKSLQARAVEKEKLDVAKRIVSQARKEGAGRWAPKTLAFAEEQIKSVEKYIHNSPDSTTEIEGKAEEATFHAQRLLEITKQAKVFSNSKPEDTALWIESNTYDLAKMTGIEDMRNLPFDQQFTKLKASTHSQAVASETAGRMSTEARRLEGELERSQLTAEQLEEQNRKVAAIAKNFKPEEAEVIRQDGNIVLRLKGMKFPSGSARLGEENFALLGKVVSAMEMYPDSSIVVEGHTDSIGSEDVNARVSQQRAESVKNYLLSAQAIPEEKIRATGRGFKKPIASNKTKAGRAANRRIDVVITTGQSTYQAE